MAFVSRRSFVAGLGAAVVAARAQAADDLVLGNARVLAGDGTEFRGGVRCRDGKIVEIGPTVTGGLDLGGGVLYPGIHDAGTSLGLYEIDLEAATHDEQERSDAITPQARVVDAYNPLSEVIPVARIAGFQSTLVIPGTGTLIPGQAAWMRTVGETLAATTILAPAGVVFALGHAGVNEGPNAPRSRMGVAMKIRDYFDANPPPSGSDKKQKGDAPKPPTDAQTIIHAVLRRETKAIFVADRASDIEIALGLIKEFNLDGILLGGAEGHLLANALAAAKVPVLLGPVTVQPNGWDSLYSRYDNAALLHAKGVRFAFRSGQVHNGRTLPEEAGIAVSYGLPFGVAIAALCHNGPSFWGLNLGKIAVGAEASFVWMDGDPLQARTSVRGMWSQGAVVPLLSRQTRLFERFKTLP